MKNNKLRYLVEFITLFIALLISKKVSSFLGISSNKLLSLDSLVTFVIVSAIYYIRNLIMRKFIDTQDIQNNSYK